MNNIVQTFKNEMKFNIFFLFFSLYRLAGDGMRRGKKKKKSTLKGHRVM